MKEETSNARNLDLNLGPASEPSTGSTTNEAVNLNNWVQQPPPPQITQGVRHHRPWHRWRYLPIPPLQIPEPSWHVSIPIPPQQVNAIIQQHQPPIPPEARNITMELSHLLVDSGNGSTLQQAREGSVVAEERPLGEEAAKVCENNNGVMEDETSQKKDDVEKGGSCDGGDFFDCNICLDLAKDPVVTCCGHLFCWQCVYRWLHMHSDAKECPVCKGEVTIKSLTPIYGRGNNARLPEKDSTLKVPPRPQAKRVESLRQTIQRNAFGFPVEEMFRRLGSRIDLTRDFVQPNEPENARETAGRTASLLSRFLTSRGLRREQNPVALPNEAVGLNQNNVNTGAELGGDSSRVHSPLLQRSQSHRRTLSTLSTALNSAERLVEAYFHSHTLGRNQEQPPPVDDRDSFSSIAAVINSEGQLDTTVEIDSMISSSRRRSDASRLSDVDSGDSRAPRRRRMN